MSLQKKALANNKKVLLVLAIILAFLCTVLVSKQTNATDMCIYHQQHNEECGYVASVEGSDCQHEHSDECYQKVLVCHHQHDDTCGYKEAVAGHECEHICSNCDTTLIRTASLEIKDDRILHVESKLIGNKTEDQVYYYIQFDRDLLVDLDLSLQDKKYTIQTDDNQSLVLEPIYISNDDDNVYLKYQQDYNSTISFDLPFKNTITEAMTITYASSFDETKHTTMATIPSKTVQTKLSKTITYAASENYNAIVLADDTGTTNDSSIPLDNYITSTTVEKYGNNGWVATDSAYDGESLRITLNYSIPDGVVTPDNRVVTYQLPEELIVNNAYSGYVYDGENKVGTYTITESGLITITFDEGYANGAALKGNIRFQIRADLGEGETEEKNIVIGNTTFTIKPNQNISSTDINISKTVGEFEKTGDEYKIPYTIKISTKKGTEDVISVEDHISEGLASYNNDLVITNSKGETLTDYTIDYDNSEKKFYITNLPKLESGEEYIISYSVNARPNADGSLKVKNDALAKSGYQLNGVWGIEKNIQGPKIIKSGSSDADKQTITWTINVYDVKNGQTLTDMLPSDLTNNGQLQTISAILKDSNGNEENIQLTKNSDGKYTYQFTKDGDFTIVYTTGVSGAGQPGEDGKKYTNQATIDDKYSTSSDVWYTPKSAIIKSFLGKENNNDSFSADNRYNWQVILNIPKNKTEYVFEDILSSSNESQDGTVHYFDSIENMNLAIKADGTDIDSSKYTIQYLIADSDGNNYDDSFPTDGSKVIGYKITFDKDYMQTINQITITYTSHVDYKGEINEAISYSNKASFVGKTTEVGTNHTKKSRISKYAGTWDGKTTFNNSNEAIGFGDRYKAQYSLDPEIIDYNDTNGMLFYMVVINIDYDTADQITINDILPEGTSLVTDAGFAPYIGGLYNVRDNNLLGDGYPKCYYNDRCPDNGMTAHIKYESISGNTYQFTLDVTSMKNHSWNSFDTLALCYALKINDEYYYNSGNVQKYSNTVTWNDDSSTCDQKIRKNNISKTATQKSENVIQYSLYVNPTGIDLLENSDKLTLIDNLTTDITRYNYIGFVSNSLKVYPVTDGVKGEEEIDSSLYSYKYDTNNFKLEMTIPDGMALYIEYEYEIYPKVDNVSLTNKVSLHGIENAEDENQFEWKESGSSAVVDKNNMIQIIKVDSENYNILLNGAKFDLYEYGNKNPIKKDIETGNNQSQGLANINISSTEEGYYIQKGVLYYFLEKSYPDEYTYYDSNKTYFVLIPENSTLDQTKQSISAQIATEGLSIDDVHFLSSNGGEIYIPNKRTSLHIKKSWLNSNGTTYSGDKPEIDLNLYRSKVNIVQEKEPYYTVNLYLGDETVSKEGYDPVNFTKSTYEISVNSGFKIKVDNYGSDFKDHMVVLINDEKIDIDNSGSAPYYYIVPAQPENTVINIRIWNIYWGAPISNYFSISDYTESKTYEKRVPSDEKEKIATIHMKQGQTPTCIYDESFQIDDVSFKYNDNYEVKFTNLPVQENDCEYAYFIEENKMDGWTSSITNNGITSGTINVVNTKDKVLETLPETGGFGTLSIILSGLTMICFSLLCFLKKKLNYRKVGEHK